MPFPDHEITVTAHAKGAALTESSAKKTPQVEVLFEITAAEFAGEQISWIGFLTDKTAERTIESLRYAGWRGSDLSDLSDLAREDAPSVELVIAPEAYEGKTYHRVRWVNRGGGRVGAQLPAEQTKLLAAKYRGAIAAVDAKLKSEGNAPAKAFDKF